MTNLVDRFYAAVSVLAGDGHIKQRLICAFQEHLDDIEDDELPLVVREGFADLKRRMHGVAPLNGEGPICASVRKMSGPEAGACGEAIVALHAEVLRLSDGLPQAVPLSSEEARQVPPFLVKSVS